MRLASQIIKNVVTMADGESYAIARILTVIAALAHVVLSAFALSKGFDPLNFGTGFAAIIAADSFGVKAEEPK